MKYRLDYCCNSSSSSFICRRSKFGSVFPLGSIFNNFDDYKNGFICYKCGSELLENYWILPSKEEYIKIFDSPFLYEQNVEIENKIKEIVPKNYDTVVKKKEEKAALYLIKQILFLKNCEFTDDFIQNDVFQYIEDINNFQEIEIPSCFCPYCQKQEISEHDYIRVLISIPENDFMLLNKDHIKVFNKEIFKSKGYTFPLRTCDIISECKKILKKNEALEYFKRHENKLIKIDEVICSDDQIHIF